MYRKLKVKKKNKNKIKNVKVREDVLNVLFSLKLEWNTASLSDTIAMLYNEYIRLNEELKKIKGERNVY